MVEAERAVTVQAGSNDFVMTTWTNYYGYLYARAGKVVGGSVGVATGVPFDIVVNCGLTTS